MKRQIILGVSAATLVITLHTPAIADDEMRTIRQILTTISQFDRGYGHVHRHRAYHDDDDDGPRRGSYHRRFDRDDDDDDRGHRRGSRGGRSDDDDDD